MYRLESDNCWTSIKSRLILANKKQKNKKEKEKKRRKKERQKDKMRQPLWNNDGRRNSGTDKKISLYWQKCK